MAATEDGGLSEDSRVTVVLPTKGQVPLLKGFLNHGIDLRGVRLLIADGSLDESLRRRIEELDPPNTDYIRFPPDTTRRRYLEKLAEATLSVRTPYAMLGNIDDYILQEGVDEAVALLEENPNAAAAGCCVVVRQPWHWAGRWEPEYTVSLDTNSARSVSSAIHESLSRLGGVGTTFYDVHRSDALSNATKLYAKVGPGRPFADQFFALCTLRQGAVLQSPSAHYAHTQVEFFPPWIYVPPPLEAYNTNQSAVDSWHEAFLQQARAVMNGLPDWAEEWADDLKSHRPMMSVNRTMPRLQRIVEPVLGENALWTLKVRYLGPPRAYLRAFMKLFNRKTLRLLRAPRRPSPPRIGPGEVDNLYPG